MPNYIDKMTGYKATDKDIVCSGESANGKKYSHQFELGKWYEVDGEIELCKRGFHFCVHPSGPWSFYSNPDSRVFKIEAEQVLECPTEAGADFKLVAKRIRLVEEITPGKDGNWNTGNSNTGDSNTGNRNTGYWNNCDRSSGFFCSEPPKVKSFDVQTDLTHDEFLKAFPESNRLGDLLAQDDPISFSDFKGIPGITESKLSALHKAFIQVREKSKAK